MTPSFIIATIFLALTILLTTTSLILRSCLRPGGDAVKVATVAGWGVEATYYGIDFSYDHRNLFTFQPGLATLMLTAVIAAVLFLRNDLNHRHERKRGFDVAERK